MIIRWMLQPGMITRVRARGLLLFQSHAEPDKLSRSRITGLVKRGLSAGRDVYVMAANNAEGSAPLTLQELAMARRDPDRLLAPTEIPWARILQPHAGYRLVGYRALVRDGHRKSCKVKWRRPSALLAAITLTSRRPTGPVCEAVIRLAAELSGSAMRLKGANLAPALS